jgi:serine protease Do
VGVYHAGYIKGTALNAVVGIDQVRDVMSSLRPTPKTPEGALPLTQENRAKVVAASRASTEPFFPCGSLTAAVRARDDGTVLYELHDRQFPLRPFPIVVLEDLAGNTGVYGAPGKAFFGNFRGLKGYSPADIDPATGAELSALLDAFRKGSLAALAVRSAERDANGSRVQFDRIAHLEKALQHASAGCQAPGETAAQLADKLGPLPNEPAADLRTVLLNAPLPSMTEPLPGAPTAAPRVASLATTKTPGASPGTAGHPSAAPPAERASVLLRVRP